MPDRPDDWFISLDLDPADVPALEAALPLAIPAERYAVVTSDARDDDEDAYLTMTVTSATLEEAYDAARTMYAEAREKAGLPPATPEIRGYVSAFMASTSLDERLRDEARQLASTGRHALAVVRAQSAAEVYVRQALEDLLLRRGGKPLVEKLLRRDSATLTSDSARGLWYLLTGARVEDSEWWESYRHHINRRNGIVHEGLAVTERDATASIEVVERLIDTVQRGWALGAFGVEP